MFAGWDLFDLYDTALSRMFFFPGWNIYDAARAQHLIREQVYIYIEGLSPCVHYFPKQHELSLFYPQRLVKTVSCSALPAPPPLPLLAPGRRAESLPRELSPCPPEQAPVSHPPQLSPRQSKAAPRP